MAVKLAVSSRRRGCRRKRGAPDMPQSMQASAWGDRRGLNPRPPEPQSGARLFTIVHDRLSTPHNRPSCQASRQPRFTTVYLWWLSTWLSLRSGARRDRGAARSPLLEHMLTGSRRCDKLPCKYGTLVDDRFAYQVRRCSPDVQVTSDRHQAGPTSRPTDRPQAGAPDRGVRSGYRWA